mgnify:CR=1 FL=1
MKVVINRCHGGFGLSDEAMQMYAAKKGIQLGERHSYGYDEICEKGDIPRDDPVLVEVVEHLGDAANGDYAELKVVEIPEDVDWYIHEYDGNEHIAERHRTWS